MGVLVSFTPGARVTSMVDEGSMVLLGLGCRVALGNGVKVRLAVGVMVEVGG